MNRVVVIAAFSAALLAPSGAFAVNTDSSAIRYLLEQSLGIADSNSCITCDFFAHFMLNFANFSKAVNLWFLGLFRVFVPVIMMCWIGFRVSALMSRGGEDGRTFIYAFLRKMALFTVVWMLVVSSSGGGRTFESASWRAAGPDFIGAAFEFAGQTRDRSMQVASGQTLTGFNCGDVQPRLGTDSAARGSAAARYDFIQPAVEMACVVERSHMLGLVVGITTITSKTDTSDGFWSSLKASSIIAMITKLITGIVICILFAYAGVWLVFLILDIIARVLLVSMLLPVFAACAIFESTRPMATAAAKSLLGSFVTAVGLALVSVFASVMLLGVVPVYNMTYAETGEALNIASLTAIETRSGVLDFVTFIKRTQTGDYNTAIPVNFATPWFWYLCLCPIAVAGLGKKIIGMLQDFVGQQTFSAMADTARQSVSTAASGAMKAATVVGLGKMAMDGTKGGLRAAGGGVAGAGKLGLASTSSAGRQAIGQAASGKARSAIEGFQGGKNIFGNIRSGDFLKKNDE